MTNGLGVNSNLRHKFQATHRNITLQLPNVITHNKDIRYTRPDRVMACAAHKTKMKKKKKLTTKTP